MSVSGNFPCLSATLRWKPSTPLSPCPPQPPQNRQGWGGRANTTRHTSLLAFDHGTDRGATCKPRDLILCFFLGGKPVFVRTVSYCDNSDHVGFASTSSSHALGGNCIGGLPSGFPVLGLARSDNQQAISFSPHPSSPTRRTVAQPRVLKLACFIHPLSTTARMVQIKVFYIPSDDGQQPGCMHARPGREQPASSAQRPKRNPKRNSSPNHDDPWGCIWPRNRPSLRHPPSRHARRREAARRRLQTDCVLCWAVEVC